MSRHNYLLAMRETPSRPWLTVEFTVYHAGACSATKLNSAKPKLVPSGDKFSARDHNVARRICGEVGFAEKWFAAANAHNPRLGGIGNVNYQVVWDDHDPAAMDDLLAARTVLVAERQPPPQAWGNPLPNRKPRVRWVRGAASPEWIDLLAGEAAR